MSLTSEWRSQYERRIRSSQWKNIRKDIARLRGSKCERCGVGGRLELHHKTYERLGRELLSDLELLCETCHKIADKERATAGRIRSVNARYEAALNTYAAKKYGEDYQWLVDDDQLGEEFDEWLRRQGDDH